MWNTLKSRLKHVPWIAHRYRVWRDAQFARVSPRPTPFGFLLSGQSDMMAGTFEPAETKIIRALIKTADVFIDVGANIGYYICHALQSNPKCSAIAIEPLASNVRYLCRNVKANGWENQCEILPVAASSRSAVVSLFGAGTGASLIRGWNGAPDSSAALVPAHALDNILGGRFRGQRLLIMIDVEGHERDVLEGASDILSRSPKPFWFVEIGGGDPLNQRVGNPSFVAVFKMFFAAGYEAWACTTSPHIVTAEDVESAARNSGALGTHNFLFAERGSDVLSMILSSESHR